MRVRVKIDSVVRAPMLLHARGEDTTTLTDEITLLEMESVDALHG